MDDDRAGDCHAGCFTRQKNLSCGCHPTLGLAMIDEARAATVPFPMSYRHLSSKSLHNDYPEPSQPHACSIVV